MRDWDLWIVRADLRLLLVRGQFDLIASFQSDEKIRNEPDVRRTVDFYRGVALLHGEAARATDAVTLFDRLTREVPSEPAFAANLFAARVRALIADIQTPASVGVELRERIARTLRDGEAIMSALPAEGRARVEPNYQANRMHLLAALGDWGSVLTIYQGLETRLRTDPILGGYAVRALHMRGDDGLARQLLDQLDTRAENARFLDPVRKELEGAATRLSSPPTIDDVEDAQRIRQHLNELARRAPTVQARVWGKSPHRPLQLVIADEIIDLCGQLPDLVRSLARPANKEPGEDRVTEILVRLARQRFHRLGWTVHFQDPGGYTGKDPGTGRGGVGELDVRIVAGDRTISIAEAVRVWPTSENDMREHFEKLFGYAREDTPVLFMLLWSFADDASTMIDVHRRAIATPPVKFARGRSRLNELQGGDGVQVLDADEHEGGHLVVHLLVDFKEAARRNVAKTARARRPPKARV